MRSRTVLCCLALAVLGWTSSSHAALQEKANGVDVERNQVLESPEVDWQVVAIRQKGVDHCPTVPDWNSDDNWLVQTLRPLYQLPDQGHRNDLLQLTLRQAIASEPLLKELDRFCAYRKTLEAAQDFPMQPLPAGLEKAAKSRMALVPAGDPISIFGQHFLDQASGIPPSFTLPPGKRPVRLVFIDTQPDQDGVPRASGPSKHGYSLVHQAQRLICPGVAPCPIEFATRLALPHPNRDLPPSESNANSPGGNLGLVDELAAAILREVWAWQQAGSKQHLILNLSLGWDGEWLGELDKSRVSQLRTDTRLVYEALLFARRSGALVIAAAGNRRGGEEESTWPLLPAAWEMRRPPYLSFPIGPKPVYAVGGVDWQGLPLPNYRQGGLPRRVAFGDHAVAQTENSDEPSAMYTGSSVSTAVVSSIAAVVWHLRPELRPSEVMRLITRSGNELPGQANYYAWKDLWPLSHLMKAPNMRRLSLCQAVLKACADGGRCAVPSCPPWSPTQPADLRTLNQGPTLPLLDGLRATTLPSRCKSASNPAPGLFTDPSSISSEPPCPLYLLTDIVSQRWVAPQPDDPPCPGCSFVPPPRTSAVSTPQGYILVIKIDPKWQPPTVTIESAALDVDRYSGGKFVERMTYRIPSNALPSLSDPNDTHRLLLKDIGYNHSLMECTATLNFAVLVGGKKLSVQSPVYVDP